MIRTVLNHHYRSELSVEVIKKILKPRNTILKSMSFGERYPFNSFMPGSDMNPMLNSTCLLIGTNLSIVRESLDSSYKTTLSN